MDGSDALRAVIVLVVLAYLPGRIWVGVLLAGMQRIPTLFASVCLSLALLALSLYLGNVLIGVPIDGMRALLWAGVWCAAGIAPPLRHWADGMLERRLAR